MFKSPGEIPENDPEWKVAYNSKGQLLAEAASAEHHEMKSDGDRRRCKWCIRYLKNNYILKYFSKKVQKS